MKNPRSPPQQQQQQQQQEQKSGVAHWAFVKANKKIYSRLFLFILWDSLLVESIILG